ncbi:MAG: helix-turn-helix transcriptional regulator [Deltaproteobacteria bacterium]|nr:helix-turn-helix transcriptional regulator [Deltaproteobacteria bacterium]MBW2551212.1 helix-turn-helix transcriptional regulator [Deltaproteobacteria bacterium]MBW2628557.1 helix-turn-helix transcriptional regulator [Deltaproteobacteria bacterium]MBW2687291.1 helix-turn-helix transcriptional regulator [Deltaproteobacteria bacterium]
MDDVASAIIDFTEAVYDLELSNEDWLPTVLKRGLPVLEHGLGVAGIEYGRPPDGGPVRLLRIHVASGPEDFPELHSAAIADTPLEMIREQARPGQATTMSMSTRSHPEALELYTSHVSYCKDVLGITTVDCKGAGAAIVAPLHEKTILTGRAAERWQMLAAHLDAGHRLRQALSAHEADHEPCTDLPFDGEAIFDANGLRLAEAVGQAKERTAATKLREGAVALDRARGKLRETDPEKALKTWKALVWGRWSLVDWFDTDGRRFVLAIPNPPHVTDPRGLTERENQVVGYAMLGDTNKIIAYRLGLSTSRVSLLLRSAMKKLGFRTRAHLVRTIREFQALH